MPSIGQQVGVQPTPPLFECEAFEQRYTSAAEKRGEDFAQAKGVTLFSVRWMGFVSCEPTTN